MSSGAGIRNKNKYTLKDFLDSKTKGIKIPVLTCYDYSHSRIMANEGVDVLLVGDSLGMVVLGYENTLQVTMEDMIRHTAAVRRGSPNAFIIADMPYLSYEANPQEALINAGKLIVQGGADAVKIEGGRMFASQLKALKAAKIPVIGHIGLTPQSVNMMGGFKTQGKNPAEIISIIEDLKVLIAYGAVGVVLECIPEELAKLITAGISIPTVGIGAGRFCDGQVLVNYDILGLYSKNLMSFVRQYGDIGEQTAKAYGDYAREVREGAFPDDSHCTHLRDEMIELAEKELEKVEDYRNY